MTRNRNRKLAIRRLAQKDNVPYNVARRRLMDPDHAPQRPARWIRATEALDTTRANLIPMLAAIAALPVPSGPLAGNLVERTLDILDARVPISSVRTAFDLEDAATDHGHNVMPPIPRQISSSTAAIDKQLLGPLSATDLRTAAVGLGLLQGTAGHGSVTALIRDTARTRRESKKLLDTIAPLEWPSGYPDADEDAHETDPSHRTQVKAMITDLQTRQPTDWEPIHIAALRTAISIHLAQLGDAFLRTSEQTPVKLTWHETSSTATQAEYPLPGLTRPVTAIVTTAPMKHPTTRIPLFPESSNPLVPTTTARCSVGTFDESGVFDEYASSNELSELAAQFAAAEYVTAIANNPHTVRSRTSHRLLVSPAAPGDPAFETIDLLDVLQAVGSQHDDDPEEEFTWTSHPHITSGDDYEDLSSVVALVLDSSACPLPQPTEEAGQHPLGTEPFEQFLTDHGVQFTDMARTYLTAQQLAGPDNLPLSDRHSAGMQAVFNKFTGAQLVAELSRRPHPTEELILSTIHVLHDLMTIRYVRGVLAAHFLPQR